MTFPLNIYALSFVTAALVTALTLPLWRLGSHRLGLIDDPGHRKLHHIPVPLAGGLAVLTGIFVPLLAAAFTLLLLLPASPPEPGASFIEPFALDLFRYGFNRRTIQLLVILFGAIGMLALGLWDDKYELRPLAKFSGQFVIAAAVAASGIRITLFIDNAPFNYAVTILWIVTLINATNFMDNMNGLCAGLGLIGTWSFAWTAASHGQYLVAAIGFLASGALLGFLPFNFPKATVFLGDAGSHLVGYLLAVLAILPHFHTTFDMPRLAVLKPLLILGVILADLVSVVYIRWRLGKPFYIGDQNHFSHRLVRSGFSPTLAVLLLWLVAASLSSLAFL
jgi:UDP-GlcNAc:undecaprenyl-phosphate/decaprenyl-phosphate GlcNAc-1-phosphate transferase